MKGIEDLSVEGLLYIAGDTHIEASEVVVSEISEAASMASVTHVIIAGDTTVGTLELLSSTCVAGREISNESLGED